MHLPKFEHVRATSLKEACTLLEQYGHRAHLVAGGTDLFPRMKYGLVHSEVIVSLKGVPVKKPGVSEKGHVHLDAFMTLAEVCRSPLVKEKLPLLAEAALNVGSRQIREMATLGGNICLENRCLYYNQTHRFQFLKPCFKREGDRCYLIPEGKKCWAVYCADTVPALISLGASVGVRGPESDRQVLLERIYTGDAVRPLALSRNEIVTEVIVPPLPPMTGAAFVKFALRGGIDFSALNLGVVLIMDKEGTFCLEGRITVGAVSSAPLRALKAEEALRGVRLSDDLLESVAYAVADDVHPFPHHGYSAGYLRECLKVETRRAIKLATARVPRY